MATVKEVVAKNLRFFRKNSRWTQAELAQKAGITQQTVTAYETGKVGNITSDMIEKLAKALNIEESDLINPHKEPETLRLKPDLWEAALVLAEAVEQYRSGKGSPLIQDLIKRLKSNDAL